MLDKKQLQYIFLFTLIGAALVLSFLVMRPYLITLVLALVIAVAVDPIYLFIRRIFRGKKGIAAFVSIVFILLVIVIPISFFAYQVFLEAQDIYTAIASGETHFPILERAGSLNNFFRTVWDYLQQEIGSIGRSVLNFFLSNVGGVFSSVASIFLNFFLFFIAIFYILSNRENLYMSVKRISPLEDAHNDIIIHKVRAAFNSVIRGNLLVALIQGVVASIGFTIFGVPNPMLWGGFAAIAALVPTVGTTLVTAPAIAYLFLSGETGAAIGLLIWAVAAVGMIDNILAPILIDRGIHLHPFLILLAVLGGVSLFGAAGFVLGPIILAFLFVLLEIYEKKFPSKDLY